MATAAFSIKTKIFHWLTALMILTIIPLGVIATDAPIETDAQIATKTLLFSMHKTLGVAVFLVALARIAYALTQSKPAPLHPERRLETALAETVHWLLYISLVFVPLTGWIHHSAAAVAAPIWLPFANHLPFVPTDPTVSDFFGGLHWLWSKIMIVSILLHVAGALKHHVIDKDATLQRMWFGHTATTPRVGGRQHISAVIAGAIYLGVAGIGAAAGALSTAKDLQQPVALTAVPSQWAVETGTIGLTITQLGNQVTGEFTDWVSEINFEDAATGVVGQVTTTINIGSLTLGTVTAQAMGPDFFDQTQFPTAIFAADLIKTEGRFFAEGTLSIKGVSVPVAFPFDLGVTDDVASMSGGVTLNRRDFGIADNMSDESNLGFVVEVNLALTARRS
ncbi:MAG: cytochrome b/b6 domain-containing protein [Yoonia sp.]|nr:cytochrome b/b6 domain-containing protein [Yoonia sp.]